MSEKKKEIIIKTCDDEKKRFDVTIQLIVISINIYRGNHHIIIHSIIREVLRYTDIPIYALNWGQLMMTMIIQK